MSSLTRKERILACGIEISLLLRYEHTKRHLRRSQFSTFASYFLQSQYVRIGVLRTSLSIFPGWAYTRTVFLV